VLLGVAVAGRQGDEEAVADGRPTRARVGALALDLVGDEPREHLEELDLAAPQLRIRRVAERAQRPVHTVSDPHRDPDVGADAGALGDLQVAGARVLAGVGHDRAAGPRASGGSRCPPG
jgi:hypothetical protein